MSSVFVCLKDPNSKMDELAKSFALRMIHGRKTTFQQSRHYASFLTCWWKEQPILQDMFHSLYSHISFGIEHCAGHKEHVLLSGIFYRAILSSELRPYLGF